MAGEKADAVLRPKRQITVPKEICDTLGIGPGDVLELTVEGTTIVVRPRKNAALAALKEIHRAFKDSEITEEELQEAGRRVRREVARERHGIRS